jgi:hypothetical protein
MVEESPSEVSQQYKDLMAAVGTALHGWSLVESAMGILFSAASCIPGNKRAGAIFDTILSFEIRLAVLNTAVEWSDHLADDERELWICLSRRLRSLYKKRHAIAHFGVSSSEDMFSGRRISPFFSWHKHNMKSEKYLTIMEIYARSNKFGEASNAVGWFVNLVQHRTLPAQSRPRLDEEPELILHIRESLSRSQEAQQPPHQSSPE